MQETLAGYPAKDQALTRQALEAQAALLPYALATFAICLPIFVWGGSLAPNSVWMSVTFALFAAAWGIFYAAVSWIKAPTSQAPDRGQVAPAGRLRPGLVALQLLKSPSSQTTPAPCARPCC